MVLTASLDWIKRVTKAVMMSDQRPQFGSPTFTFPIEAFKKAFETRMTLNNLSLEQEIRGWLESAQFLEGFGVSCRVLKLSLQPLNKECYLMFKDQDVRDFMAYFLAIKEPTSCFFEESIVRSFFVYLAAELIYSLEEIQTIPGAQIKLLGTLKGEALLNLREPSFTVDANMAFDGKMMGARLLLPNSFRDAWKTHVAKTTTNKIQEEVKDVPVDLTVNIGYAAITLQDLQTIEIGDAILLDRCTFDPDTKQGLCLLSLGGTTLLHGTFTPEGVKIVNQAHFDEKAEDTEWNLDDFDFEDLDPTNNPSGKPNMSSDTKLKIEELELDLSIEVGKVRMTVKEITNLSVGNVINLSVQPEHGVDLVVKGKVIGKGELVKIGDMIGVRVLKI